METKIHARQKRFNFSGRRRLRVVHYVDRQKAHQTDRELCFRPISANIRVRLPMVSGHRGDLVPALANWATGSLGKLPFLEARKIHVSDKASV